MGDKSNFAVGRGEGMPAQHTVIFMSRVWGEADFSRFHEIEFSYPN